jgi:hypothetical protein
LPNHSAGSLASAPNLGLRSEIDLGIHDRRFNTEIFYAIVIEGTRFKDRRYGSALNPVNNLHLQYPARGL